MRLSRILAMAALACAVSAPASAQSSGAGRVKVWPRDGAWLTELRRDADGSFTCITGAPFSQPHTFVLEFASRSDMFALMLIDQSSSLGGGTQMTVTLDGNQATTLPIMVSGPARITRAPQSAEVRALLPKFAAAGSVAIVADGTRYDAAPGALAAAAKTLSACEQEMRAR